MSGLAPTVLKLNIFSAGWTYSQLLTTLAIGTGPTLILNSILIANTGTTFGKAIFGIKIKSGDLTNISISQAMHREFLVLFFGLGLNVVVLNLIANAIGYRQLLRTGAASWDTELGTVCLYDKRKFVPYFATVLVITLLILKALLDAIFKIAFPEAEVFL